MASLSTTPALASLPNADPAWLKKQFVGSRIADVPAPAVILDAAVVRRNCERMLTATKQLGVGFRAHVKTHKTIELTKLQVGDGPVKLVASTIAEIEYLVPWLQECKSQGREVNVLYGLPIAPSFLPRLAAIVRTLGPGSIGLFVDHPAQLPALEALDDATWPGPVPVFPHIDVGYHREGVPAGSPQLTALAAALAHASKATLGGFYAHMGHSYGVSSPEEALDYMGQELAGLAEGARAFLTAAAAAPAAPRSASTEKIVLSLGATPTAASIQNLLLDHAAPNPVVQRYRQLIADIGADFAIEYHAGVYPVLDLQQLATRARPAHVEARGGVDSAAPGHSQSLASFADIAHRTLVEVASVYPDRGAVPEALIAAGSIVLGRDPCKSYAGWGVVTPWTATATAASAADQPRPHYDPEAGESERTGWIVGRISQEHGILTWQGPREKLRELKVGEKLLLWPNHACMAGASFGWYLVVDSDRSDPDEIVDVWVRCRGW